MRNTIYSKLINKLWISEDQQEMRFHQSGENLICTNNNGGVLFETNNKISQELHDTGIEQSIETITNFVTDTDLFLTILTSVPGQGISTHFEFLTLRSENTLVHVTTSPISPKIETIGKETIDDLYKMREVYSART